MSGRAITRRQLLGLLLASAGAAACGLGRHPVASPDGPPLRVVFFSDVHARSEWDTPRALAQAAAAINAARPDLVIAGGDLITDGFQSSAASVEERWRVFLAMRAAIKAPFYPTMGNHDLVGAIPEDGSAPSADPRAVYRAKLGVERTWYAFTAGGYRFFVLDSVRVTGDALKYEGRIGEEQLAWLRAELATLPAEQRIVLVTHIPLLTSFYQATDGATHPAPRNRVVVNNREVLEVFAGRRLVAVLQGHLHVNERLWWRGTTFVTGGAVSGKWWRGPWLDTQEGFGVLTLDGDRVEWEYIDYGWEAQRPPDPP